MERREFMAALGAAACVLSTPGFKLKKKYVVLGGNARLEACKLVGYDSIKCYVVRGPDNRTQKVLKIEDIELTPNPIRVAPQDYVETLARSISEIGLMLPIIVAEPTPELIKYIEEFNK
ncbi:MAG: hypothetical protein CL489_06265 [Acidobacteria bacterium]|nr:hypothetical protein [Acidobacteriota bacterium]|tara:strand:- start:38847 stop:39203 length:357 start_codon:yes stop_codon:yes gene_type:complete